MAPDNKASQIVVAWTDARCGTGEQYYRTADGTVWKTNYNAPPSGNESTGQIIGVRQNETIRRR